MPMYPEEPHMAMSSISIPLPSGWLPWFVLVAAVLGAVRLLMSYRAWDPVARLGYGMEPDGPPDLVTGLPTPRQIRGWWGVLYAAVIAGVTMLLPVTGRGAMPMQIGGVVAVVVLTALAIWNPRGAAWVFLVPWLLLAVPTLRGMQGPMQFGGFLGMLLPLPFTPGPLLHLGLIFRGAEPEAARGRLYQVVVLLGLPALTWLIVWVLR
jgi:hypothetical protein